MALLFAIVLVILSNIQDNIENKDLPQSLGNLVKNFTEELK